MPTFVDFAGMNTLVSSSIDGNTLSSGINSSFTSETINSEDELVGINLHRNGPYGYSSWKQLRASENPITRHHKANSTMTFVIQPGPMRNVLSNGELRVRDRHSALYTFTEPAIAQKAYPLVWNVGKHFKDENGNVDLDNPERFSIISSYANQGIGFANDEVDKLHKFDPDEEKTEYREIYKLYAEGGLNDQASPLTYWEFLQYRETVFPHMKNQFQNENLERPNFVSFYRHNREDRTRSGHELFETNGGALDKSTWPLDASLEFLTETKTNDSNISFPTLQGRKSGVLQSDFSPFMKDLSNTMSDLITSSDPATVAAAKNLLNQRLIPGPVYNRKISLLNYESVSNPSGMTISQSISGTNNVLFEGSALWEAGLTREVPDPNDSDSYISAPRAPFYDTYEGYIEEARKKYKNFSVVPEFRISAQVEDYLKNENNIELDMFDVTGGAENAQNSSESQFYEIYSNSDFMRQFELINEDHKEFTNGKVLSLRCKAVKKFLPYEGLYPAQRTVDISKRFYDSFKDHIKVYDGAGTELTNFNYGAQLVMTPLFSPGILFNTIKSGVAVDYPIISNILDATTGSLEFFSNEYLITNNFDRRIPFEALIEPKRYLSGYNLTSNEPHPSGNVSASANWDGEGDELYGKMINNFLAEIPEFFLPNGQLTSVVSKKQKDISLVSGSVYGMRIKMKRSMSGTKSTVYHYGTSSITYLPPQDIITGSLNRENFTMYSRPSAFGPPSMGLSIRGIFNTASDWSLFTFDSERESFNVRTSDTVIEHRRDSVHGYNFPFTPPYYHGESWCDITVTASSNNMSILDIQSAATYDFTRFDNSFYAIHSSSTVYGIGTSPSDKLLSHGGPQSLARINTNAVQLSSSLNIQGIGKVKKSNKGMSQELIVDTALDEDSRWIIQTKFETPMLNFNHVNPSISNEASESIPRGIWHQYGRIPKENEGVFIEVGPIEQNYRIQAKGETNTIKDLSEVLGFSGNSTKIGRLRSSKTIYEAVVAVPFIELEGRKKFFSLDTNMVQAYKDGGESRSALTTGDPQNQIGRSVLNQLQKMEKYIFPPSFDFLNNSIDDVKPVAMYIFEFSHTLSQQDLSDIWQNLPPDIGTTMEESEVAITHPLLKKELLGEGGGQSGNTLIDMPNKLRWMVFKVKQRAASNYFKKTVLRNPEVNTDVENSNTTVDEFGSTSGIQYNWPYDFFSLVELVKLDAEVEFGNFRDEDIANYTDSIPPYEGQNADRDKIESIVGGMEDDIVPDVQVPENPLTENISVSTQVFAGQSLVKTPTLGLTAEVVTSLNEEETQSSSMPSLKDQMIQSFKVEFSQEYPNVTGTKRRKIRVANRRATDRVREKYSDVFKIHLFSGEYKEYPGTPKFLWPGGADLS